MLVPMNMVDQQAQQAGEAAGAAQVAALAAPDNPAAAQAIAAETKTQAVGAMQAGFLYTAHFNDHGRICVITLPEVIFCPQKRNI